MSSSDSDTEQKNDNKNGSAHQIKPSKGGAQIDTSTWPLLLKVRNHEPTFYIFIKYYFFHFWLYFLKHTLNFCFFCTFIEL